MPLRPLFSLSSVLAPAPPRRSAHESVLADRARPIPEAARLPVVLVHGLWMRSPVFWRVGRALKRDGRQPLYYGYPSRFLDVPANAQRFALWLQANGPGPYDIVTHSMGAIILRWAAAHHDLPRLRRVVMIAPPNRGAQLADLLHRRMGPVFTWIYGQSGLQMRRGGRGLAENAGRPEGEIGVIAGGTGKKKGFNRWITSDNDMTVAVEETILSGMKDFVLVRRRHTPMLWARETSEYVLRFLSTGKFRLPSALEVEVEKAGHDEE